MAIDYEKEYDNRARVPEHPQIFARWEAEAKAYRGARTDAQIGLKYGPSPRQTIDFFPVNGADAPLAMFIHGGWWRALSPVSFSQMAKGLNAHGIGVAVIGYDLCPTVSIATITDQMRAACLTLWRKHKKHITVYGHSAGGHLTACMIATDWKSLEPSAPADLVPAGYAISGVFDLAPLTHVSFNADLKLDDAEARRMSPLYWTVPQGAMLDAAVGGIESNEFLRQSKTIAEEWGKRGAQTRYEPIAGADHFTVLDPLTDADSAMTRRIVELARHTAAKDR
ncbi:alpha/beta hydrolase [Undibacter mobilis]|uniref:Alpha/beta hydrolase n=1 Tax=Undibacter mobilis TaxID=2292256 RepID=A0A371B8H4_9BRAD|nr:alpha/beta hydrolase [Undibacter mobilis]RDV03895.1 alpha/beta hydrolase [Undibacter mobilis]